MSLATSFAVFALLSPGVFPQVQKTKPKTKATTATTLGTVQLPGDKGKVGTTYQLGAKGSELHFNLESAALETIHLSPDDTLVAGAKERLLALTFAVQNPLSREQRLGSSEFKFTSVSPDDENFEFRGYLLHPTKGTHIDQYLKPAQKVKCVVVFPIYAEGPVTKVMVQRGNAPVLRYDLTNKVKKLDSVFSVNGVDLVDKAKISSAVLKEGILFGPLNFAIVSTSFTSDKIQGYNPPEGERYFTIKVRFTNPMLKPTSVGFQYYMPELLSEDGEKISWNSSLLNPSMDGSVYQDLAPGDSVVGIYYFRVKNSQRPGILRFTHNNSKRVIELPVTG